MLFIPNDSKYKKQQKGKSFCRVNKNINFFQLKHGSIGLKALSFGRVASKLSPLGFGGAELCRSNDTPRGRWVDIMQCSVGLLCFVSWKVLQWLENERDNLKGLLCRGAVVVASDNTGAVLGGYTWNQRPNRQTLECKNVFSKVKTFSFQLCVGFIEFGFLPCPPIQGWALQKTLRPLSGKGGECRSLDNQIFGYSWQFHNVSQSMPGTHVCIGNDPNILVDVASSKYR